MDYNATPRAGELAAAGRWSGEGCAMSLVDDVQDYERWLRASCDVVKKGLKKKHELMAENPFRFFRATCFRFARTMPQQLPGLSQAPRVPSAGDAHIENFGTWRDAEGRLVWGLNDFDEAADLPCTYDLVRLATSARLAPELAGSDNDRVRWILSGYLEGLEQPAPQIFDGRTEWMGALLGRPASKPGDPKDAEKGSIDRKDVPNQIADALDEQLPAGTRGIRYSARQRGGGSLGRPRYQAEGKWRGGQVFREAKALVPSAWDWAAGTPGPVGQFLVLATGRYRSPDPFLCIRSGFVIRRIAWDSEKINLTSKDAAAFNANVLSAMGADLAAIHLSGGVEAKAIRRDLDARSADWLEYASREAAAAVVDDFEAWRKHWDGKDD